MSERKAAPFGKWDQRAVPYVRRASISVIVPTCDRPEFLARALSSVVAQSFEDWECIVVNDAPAARPSVDALLHGLGDARISAYHNEVNKGVAAARNAGIVRTTGRYLAFLDDDDYWLPDHLSRVFVTHEASREPILIYTNFVQQWEGGIVAPRLTTAKPPPDDVTRGLLQGTYNIVTMSTVSFSRSCIDEVGMFDPDLKTGQDWDFYLRASARFRFVHLERYSVVYYNHSRHRLTSDYLKRLSSLSVVMDKWKLDATFLRNKTRFWKYMALDDMIYASSKKDIVGKYKALTYFFSFPAPFTSPMVLAKLLVIAVLPYPLYSAIVRRCNREREDAARRLLDAVKTPEPNHSLHHPRAAQP